MQVRVLFPVPLKCGARSIEPGLAGPFGAIAGLAEQLEVPGGIRATSRDRNDVIEFHVLLAPAFAATPLISTPDFVLNGFGDRLASRALTVGRSLISSPGFLLI